MRPLDRWIARVVYWAEGVNEEALRVIDDVFCGVAWVLVATVGWVLFAQWVSA